VNPHHHENLKFRVLGHIMARARRYWDVTPSGSRLSVEGACTRTLRCAVAETHTRISLILGTAFIRMRSQYTA
jgi:hypothetical protein